MYIDNLMEYAINLADSEFQHEGEDLFKLAGLCEEIAIELQGGAEATKEVEDKFNHAIKAFFIVSGPFRAEVEHHAFAKQLIQSI